MPTNETIEQEIQDKHLTAPRVTLAEVEAEISAEFYFTANAAANALAARATYHPTRESVIAQTLESLQMLTFCVLVLRNGFTVTGESACASVTNFDAEIGRKIARQHAVDKLWPLLGFRLRDQLAQPVLTDADAAADLAGMARPSDRVAG